MDDLKAAKETKVTGTPREGTRHTAGNQKLRGSAFVKDSPWKQRKKSK